MGLAPSPAAPNRKGKTVWWFAFSALILIAISRDHRWLASGEMWAEMGSNYFLHARQAAWPAWLISTDAGYLPIPQRLLAALAHVAHIPVAWIPHTYNTFAVVFTSLALAAFAHSWFRPLLRNDIARAVICLLWGTVLDFETRSFINFTYACALLIALACARVIATPQDRIPRWVWLFPLLLLSKPAVLTAYPLIVLAALCSRGKMRVIAALCSLSVVLQLLTLAVSKAEGIMPLQSANTGLWDALRATVGYSIGYLGTVALGHDLYGHLASKPTAILLLPGLIVVACLAITNWRKAGPSACALTTCGVVLLLGNMALNAVALSVEWHPLMHKLRHLGLYRHVIVAFWGGSLVLLGLWQAWHTNAATAVRTAGPAWRAHILLIWLCIAYAQWFVLGWRASRPPESPLLGNSEWQAQAKAIERGDTPLCVLVDPFAWGLYGQNCVRLNRETILHGPWKHTLPVQDVELRIPPSAQGRDLLAIAFVVQLDAAQPPHQVQASVQAIDGEPLAGIRFSGNRQLSTAGAAIVLRSPKAVRAEHYVTLRFSSPVRLLQMQDTQGNWEVATMWMGAPLKNESERDR